MHRLVTALAVLASVSASLTWADAPGFNEDIRPILVEHCFACHGADSASRKADLRLDRRDDAVESTAIVPGDPDSSAMLDRIFSDDPDEVMPPPSVKKPLTAEQKDLLRQWIADGAEYEPHWSFMPPSRPPVPTVHRTDWIRNPIDAFVLARLESEGLTPADEADRHALARRVSFDLTGLPPDPSVVDAFVDDPAPDAYERLVESFLSTPEWGEHRGRHWLDYARYADTHGIHFDNEREMWSYRQWVIDAFNRNMPFDRFTIVQLAGDLVDDHAPDTSPANRLDDRIASGFNRCNVTTNEGGIIDEEYLVLYTRDRTETTATVWLGLTAGCAVCHDHKFDPLSQREFYELSAFFNNTTQAAKDGNVSDTPPILVVPHPDDQPRHAELEPLLADTKKIVSDRRRHGRDDFNAWLRTITPLALEGLLPHGTPLVDVPFTEGSGASATVSLVGEPREVPLTASTTWVEGPRGKPAALLDGRAIELPDAGAFEYDQPFTVSMWTRVPANDSSYALVSRMNPDAHHRGWDVWVQSRRIAMHLIDSWPDNAVKVATTKQLPPDTWTLVTVAYDGSGSPAGISIFFDGTRQKTKPETKTFSGGSVRSESPLVIGGRLKGATAHGVGLANLTIWDRCFSEGDAQGLAKAGLVRELATLPAEDRTKAGKGLYDWWLVTVDDAFREASSRVASLEREQAQIRTRGTIAHVMNEKGEMPQAAILDRGEYDKPQATVGADTPDVLPPFPESFPKNRLGLARWLLLQEHPLTARVTVNRFWQEVFGNGLVKTSGDFGITGELPSHPELLDWLAVEFRESGWDIKKLFRLMVTSAAYRQAAIATPEKLSKDAANRLLSRGPRYRMDAEMVRDTALTVSGLLVRKIGGPSVKPYQPEGVWEAVAMDTSNTRFYKQDSGESLYRRSLYWFWKRSAPPASMEIFNAPSRETCCVRRERTNTPLQSLVTLNDPQFVEAARALADRTLEDESTTDDARIASMAMRLLSRRLDPDELEVARRSLNTFVTHYQAHPDDAEALVKVGESKARAADHSTLAAWTLLASELMNLDETLCK